MQLCLFYIVYLMLLHFLFDIPTPSKHTLSKEKWAKLHVDNTIRAHTEIFSWINSSKVLTTLKQTKASSKNSQTSHDAMRFQGSIVSFREFTGSVRDTHEPSLPTLHTNSFVDLANVIVTNGQMFLYGASIADNNFVANVLNGSLPKYQYFIDGKVDNFPAVHIATRNDTYPVCAKVWNSTAVFLSLWHPDNQYHLMNDNIIPLLINLQSNPACEYTVLQGFQCTPVLTLFMLQDDENRNRNAVSSARTMLDMIAPVREKASDLLAVNPTVHCVKRLTWGRGRLAFAVPVDLSVSRSLRILREYLRVPLQSLQLERHMQLNGYSTANYTALIMSRQNGTPRSIMDIGTIFSACSTKGIICKTCCGFGHRGLQVKTTESRHTLHSLTAEISKADILIGPHGAAMSLIIFARPGTISINLMPKGEQVWHLIFPRMAIANYGHSMIVYLPGFHTGMQVSHALGCKLFECARGLLAASNTHCVVPHVSILSYSDVITHDRGNHDLYKYHVSINTIDHPNLASII